MIRIPIFLRTFISSVIFSIAFIQIAAAVTCLPGTYWSGSACVTCTSQYYCEGFTDITNPAKNYGRERCPNGYRSGGTGLTALSECAFQTGSGKYIDTPYSTSQVTCLAGYYCPAALVGYGSTGVIIQCTGATYSGSGSSSCSDCPTGYTDNTDAGKTASTECQMQTTGGTYVDKARDPTSTVCVSGYYCPPALINYNSIGTIIACPTGYDLGGTGLASQSDCKIQTTDGTYISIVNSTTLTTCTAGYYCPAALVGYGSIGSILPCTGATYSTSGASVCTDCPIGYTANLDESKTLPSQCQIQTIGGKYIATANSSVQTDCTAGYYCPASLINYGNTGNMIICSAGSYSVAASSMCTDCAVGSYNTSGGSTSCTACQDGTTTSTVGQISCNATCSNDNEYTTSWATATWMSGNTITGLCTVTGCTGGYYLETDTCTGVGTSYWSADGSIVRTACTAGLTTIGFGPGADEASDCGKVFNMGANHLHLRSQKKTTPSLYIQLDSSVYYGNMDTSEKGNIRAIYNGTNYSIFDDSM